MPYSPVPISHFNSSFKHTPTLNVIFILYVEIWFPCAAVDLREMLQDIIQPVSPKNWDNFTPFQTLGKEMANTHGKEMHFFMAAL